MGTVNLGFKGIFQKIGPSNNTSNPPFKKYNVAELTELEVESDYDAMAEVKIARWIKAVLAAIKATQPGERKKLRFEYFEFPYTPQAAGLYASLQKEISKLVPIESQRPTIILHISPWPKESRAEKKRFITLIGGTGPLSDACILEEVIKRTHMQPDKPCITLISAPPPRPQQPSQFFRLWELLQHCTRYLQNFVHLPKENNNTYFLLSNTAHMRIKSIKKFTGLGITNVVANIAGKIASANPERVLVLGTSAAARAGLYPAYLKQSGLQKKQLLMPAAKTQNTLQSFINNVKSGADINSYGEEFLNFLVALIEKTKPTVVILACTEIPYFTQLCSNKNTTIYKERLETKLREAGIKIPLFIDSQEEMVTSIVDAAITAPDSKRTSFLCKVR